MRALVEGKVLAIRTHEPTGASFVTLYQAGSDRVVNVACWKRRATNELSAAGAALAKAKVGDDVTVEVYITVTDSGELKVSA